MTSKLFSKEEIQDLIVKLGLSSDENSDLFLFDVNNEPAYWSLGSKIFNSDFRHVMNIEGLSLLSIDKSKEIGHIVGNKVFSSEGKLLYSLIKA